MTRRRRLSADEARRVALAAAGFDKARPASPDDVRHYRRALGRIGVLQLDFVNVLLPAQYLILWSRLGPYDRARMERFIYGSGEFTEQWAHEASVVPVPDWPLLGYRRRRFEPWKHNPLNRLDNRDQYLRTVLDQVRSEGAVTAQDLPPMPGPSRKPGDWHRSIPRWALEFHFGRGKLAVVRRRSNFQRIYDLPERVIDSAMLGQKIVKADAQRELLRKSADRLGVATLQDLADFYRLSPRDAAPHIRELVEEGHLATIEVEGWRDTAYLSKTARIPRSIEGASLLSPFDPVVWFRPRAERLFGFEYRIEIYVPAERRRWGYYVLPFMLGDRIVARVDLKADRPARTLLARAAFAEHHADENEVATALADELGSLGRWLGLEQVRVECRRPFGIKLRSAATRR